MLPTKFRVNWPFGSGEELRRENLHFQAGGHGGHHGFPLGMVLAISDLQVTLMLPTKLQANWPFGSGEEEKNTFSKWWPRPSWIPIRNKYSYF